MRKHITHVAPLAVLLSTFSFSATAGTFNHDLNTNPTADGVELRAPALWRASGSHDGSGYISVTDDVNDQQGAFLLPDIDGGAAVAGFTFKAKIRNGGGSARPADGFSFSFATAADPLVAGGTVGEEGASTGLSVCMDTWDNGADDAISLDIKWNGVIAASRRFTGTKDNNEIPGYRCAPLERDADGNLISLETDASGTSDPGTFADLQISVSACGAVSVSYKGIQFFQDVVIPGWAPYAGRFVVGARTGGANDNHWVDNIQMETILTEGPYQTAVTPTEYPKWDAPDNQVISFTITDGFLSADVGSIVLRVNGTDLTSDPNTTIVHTAPDTVVTYTPSTPWPLNTRHEAVLTFKDSSMNLCTGRALFYTAPVPQEGALFIETEDFNYFDSAEQSSGHFFDFGSPVGSYNGLSAKNGIDYFQVTGNPDSDVYRTEDVQFGISVPGAPGDYDRGGVTITPDYKTGWNDAGDWYNYTRTFPNTTYKIYARLATGGLDPNARLDLVTSDPSLAGQTTQPLGIFNGPGSGGWDTFCFYPLKSADGKDVIKRLTGLTTLRLTVLENGNFDGNYLAFVPTPSPTLRPTVVSVTPTAGSETLRSPLIKVVIADADTAVVASSIKLFLGKTELSPITRTDTPGGAEASYQVPAESPLEYGSTQTAKVQFTDNDATPVMQEVPWTFNVGPFKAGSASLFIETEDFNYSDDGVNGGLFVDFGAPECTLLGKNAVLGVDYNEVNTGNDQNIYRAPTGVEVGKLGTDGVIRGDHTITCSYIVGWNDPGDWYNYTRTFPTPSKRYNVFARMASGGNPEMAELAKVTSDPTQPNQTTEKLGEFNSPATGNWDIFHTVPLRTAVGDLASLRLSGSTTLRFTVLPNANLDINYLAFVEADNQFLCPSVVTIEPPPNSTYARAPKIKFVVSDEDSKVVAASLKLTVDGMDVTSLATITDTVAGAMIEYQTPAGALPGTVHTVKVDWDDDNTTSNCARSFSWSYTEGLYNPESNLFIEAEDFNTDGGNYIPSSPGHPFNEKGQYLGLDAVKGIDYNDNTTDSFNYRANPGTTSGMAGLNDANRTGTGPRPGFETVSDYKIGWVDSGGDWFNYTRDYAAGGYYNVYARLSHGDAPDVGREMGGRLELVDDPTSSAQNMTFLGRFRAPLTGGWDTFAFVPMRDDNGALAAIQLSGVQTLRYTPEAWAGDYNFLMLVPTCPAVQIMRDGGNVVLTWGGGTLQAAPQLTGPWADVPDATSPRMVPLADAARRYWRIRCP